MALADVVRRAVSEATGIESSELTDATSTTEEAIGSAAQSELIDLLRERLHIGPLDAQLMVGAGDSLAELIDEASQLVPVYFEEGTRPHSAKISSTLFRWHPVKYAPTADVETFRAAFEDGDWKWETQSRFAGKNINPGHYFGLTLKAATAEATYYANTPKIPPDLVLLTLDVTLDNILDLTRKDTIVAIVRESVDLSAYRDVPPLHDVNEAQMASWLFADTKGGNGVTDYIGYTAHRGGYDGILFYGARAIPAIDRWRVENARNDEWFNNDFDCVRALRRNADFFNLVVFSGARLVAATRTYQCSGPQRFWRRSPGVVVPNPYFGWEEERLLALSRFHDLDFQLSRGSGFFTSKPRPEPF